MTCNLRSRKRSLSQGSSYTAQESWKRSRKDEQHDIHTPRTQTMVSWNVVVSSGPTIHDLPSELLLNILQFEITRRCKDYLSPRGPQRTESRPYSWVRLMCVCKYWRNLLQSSSELWSDVVLPEFVNNLDFMQETLRFSADAPLRIHAPSLANVISSKWHAAQVLKYIMALSPRIQYLHLLLSDHLYAYMKDIPPQVDYSSLTGLKLSDMDDIYDFDSIDPSPRFITSLTEDPLPRLARLSLKSFPASTSFALFRPTLKELVLSHVREEFSIFGLVMALKNIPLLEVLKLSSGRGTVSGLDGPSHIAAHLVRLRTLQVNLRSADATVYFLQRIVIPPHANRAVQIKEDSCPSRVPEILSHVLGPLPSIIEDPWIVSPHTEAARASLFVSLDRQLCLSFKLHRSSRLHHVQHFPDVSLQLQCNPNDYPKISEHLTERICSAFPLHKVDTLTLLHPPDNMDVENMFKCTPNVTSLRCRQTFPGGLAFPHALRVVRSNATTSFLLPILSTIELELEGDADDYRHGIPYLNVLHTGIKDRTSVGCGLQRLRLGLPDSWGAWIQAIGREMKGVAERVRCHGRGRVMSVLDTEYSMFEDLFRFYDEDS
ncbi:hypothetical protein QCA50_004912 [Cerrena zonata]|uniref:F-box domain-containing protein n=1 Tax=Cerrena zonata TaxID=2478898 RepID=A0AAW0GDL7_9APHY